MHLCDVCIYAGGYFVLGVEMSQTKIMDFCGSGDLMRAILTDHHTHDALVKGNANKKFCVLIFAEDDKTTLQGNDLSVQVDDDLRFGESMESLDGRHEPELYNDDEEAQA